MTSCGKNAQSFFLYKIQHHFINLNCLYIMRFFRHDNHLLWLSVLAFVGLTLYLCVGFVMKDSNRASSSTTQIPMENTQKNTTKSKKTNDTLQQKNGVSKSVTFSDEVESHPRSVQSTDQVTSAEPLPQFVYMDIAKQDFLKDPFTGRVIFQLRPDIAPKTCKNFLELCKNKKYVNTPFHRVIKDFMLQGGDIVHQNGTGTFSIYGGEGSTFDDESFELKHVKAGTLSMANSGPNTNGSQFFITTCATPHLDGKHVVFGQVIQGIEFIHDIEREMTDSNDAPIRKCYILNCGEIDISDLQLQPQHNQSAYPYNEEITNQTVESALQNNDPSNSLPIQAIEPSPFSL